MYWSTILVCISLIVVVSAHPGEVHERLSDSEVARRQLAAHTRHLQARSCAPSVAVYQAQRKAKRNALRKRDDTASSATSSADLPHYTNIQNYTCVTAPEVMEGPFYINNEFVRQDLLEEQDGIKLVLDIGVIDTTTCEPLENVFVELWSANATGIYSGYAAGIGRGPPSNSPSETAPGDRPRGPPRGSPPVVRNETFLRGGWPTDKNGIVELTTVYPGFYAHRTAHIHTTVHSNWSAADNGTLISHAGSVVHVGQIFFNDTWNDVVFAFEPYTQNPNKRTYNVDDRILEQESADGNNALLDLELLGDDISEGILGYITMGVNSSASYDIRNPNYLNSSSTAAVRSPTSSSCLLDDITRIASESPLFANILGMLIALVLVVSFVSRFKQRRGSNSSGRTIQIGGEEHNMKLPQPKEA